MDASPLSAIDSMGVDRDLVFRFFAVFSRFEYALKRERHIRKGKKEAEADWDTYAASVSKGFLDQQSDVFLAACKYILESPPNKQVVVAGGTLDWEMTPRGNGESDAAYILRLVRVVRNNLFHGGKYRRGPVEDPARNRRLLEAGIKILEGCLAKNEPLAQFFQEVG